MNEIIITQKQFEEIQGYSTKKTVGQIKGEIDGMLYDLGAFDKAWANASEKDATGKPIKGTEREHLVFKLVVNIRGVERTLGFVFSPVMIKVQKHKTGGRSPLVATSMPAASWLVMRNLLKAKTDAAKLGIVNIEQELLSNVIYRLPKEQGGAETTIGEIMSELIAKDQLQGKFGLEDQRECRTVSASYEVKGDEPL